jgi:hypothetical protein
LASRGPSGPAAEPPGADKCSGRRPEADAGGRVRRDLSAQVLRPPVYPPERLSKVEVGARRRSMRQVEPALSLANCFISLATAAISTGDA